VSRCGDGPGAEGPDEVGPPPGAAVRGGTVSFCRPRDIASDGQQAVSASWDGTLGVRDMATGDRQATFTEHGSRVWVDAIGLGGEALSAGEDGGIRRWDLTTHKELSPLLPPGRATFGRSPSPQMAASQWPDQIAPSGSSTSMGLTSQNEWTPIALRRCRSPPTVGSVGYLRFRKWNRHLVRCRIAPPDPGAPASRPGPLLVPRSGRDARIHRVRRWASQGLGSCAGPRNSCPPRSRRLDMGSRHHRTEHPRFRVR
jgi:hypothetical protein